MEQNEEHVNETDYLFNRVNAIINVKPGNLKMESLSFFNVKSFLKKISR